MKSFVRYSVAVYLGLLLSGTIMVPNRSASASAPGVNTEPHPDRAPAWEAGTVNAPDLLIVEIDTEAD